MPIQDAVLAAAGGLTASRGMSRSSRPTRVNALLTRQSILFARASREEDGAPRVKPGVTAPRGRALNHDAAKTEEEVDMRRMTIGALDLSVIDDNDADTTYIYDEVFGSEIYHHREMRLPNSPTIMDVGANIGLYTVWAHERYQPQAIYCYEASPRTFAYLEDNVQRLIRPDITRVSAFNHAIASTRARRSCCTSPPRYPGSAPCSTRAR
jgi:hypothetical protein